MKILQNLPFGWRPLLRVTPFADGTFDLHWNPSMVASTKIDKVAVAEAMESFASSASDIQWEL